ncbi:MAG: formylglycine-generating enzyme family protein [Planctomycetes bacterium]|jgi:formylglycine-generating enzyme required for sulfatase activity|nr:formylglycine-generating enzyme family protein [Planctomycetota bacterium]
MNRILALGVAGVATMALSSCGGGGSNLTQDLGAVLGEFQILDLTTGVIESRTVVLDLDTNADYRSTKMVFRAVAGGSGPVGSAPTAFGYQIDEVQGTTSVQRYYLGVFEVTRDQWTALAGTTPWTGFSASMVGTAAVDKPASGMSHDEVVTMLTTWNAAQVNDLALPTEAQWEYACRATTTGSFAWGEDRSDGVVDDYAVVSETAGGISGPRVVGGRVPNAFGFFDMHGNVWEFTTTDSIRGGSWRDSLPAARSANRKALDQITGHPLVGLRLILSL